MNTLRPTPYVEVNVILSELLSNIQDILGPHLIAFYLDGSLANGDFDEASDIDFVVVTDEEISADQFEVLRHMHAQMNAGASPWDIQLEGSYLSAQALRRYDPALDVHPNMERGAGERLKWVAHGPGWDTHRAILREKGIVLLGPPPHELIDPISPTDLRNAMHSALREWAARFLTQPSLIGSAGYQSYIVITLCRILYTLQHGNVVSKKVAVGWAQTSLEKDWAGLIERAWAGRQHPDAELHSEDIDQTLKMMAYVIEVSQQK